MTAKILQEEKVGFKFRFRFVSSRSRDILQISNSDKTKFVFIFVESARDLDVTRLVLTAFLRLQLLNFRS